jgi:DNA invertase Pin-like site-specific DNA recombinase
MSNEIRAVAYARVSSKEQADKELSIPAQLEAIRNYCKQKGWKLITEYIDAGKSAKTDERPEFQRMIAMAKRQNRNFEIIVVHKFDRFSRNRDDHVIYKSLLKKLGVSVHSVTEQTDSETPHGFLLEGIMEVISEFYNMNLKNETMKGMRENAKRGFHNGGYAPYGYRLSKVTELNGNSKTILVPGPDDEVATVKRIFHSYVYDGYGYKKIASMLNEDNIPSPSGEQWSYSSIHSILHNEAYIGNKIWNKHDYSEGKKKKDSNEWIRQENTHIALVSQEVFSMVKEKSKSRIKNSSLFEAVNTTYILRGLFKCPYCGSNMIGSQSGGNNNNKNKRRYYICGKYQRKGKSTCKYKSFNKEKIETAVVNALIKEFTFLSIDKVLEQETTRFCLDKNKENTFKLNSLIQQIELYNMRLDIAEQEYQRNKDKNMLSYLDDIKNKLSSFQKEKTELESVTPAPPSTEELDIIRNQLKTFLYKITSDAPDVQNALLKELLQSIQFNLVNELICIHVVLKSSDKNVILEKFLYATA